MLRTSLRIRESLGLHEIHVIFLSSNAQDFIEDADPGDITNPKTNS